MLTKAVLIQNSNILYLHRSTRAARAESVSSGEEDEEDEGFHLLTAENLFSTLLHRVCYCNLFFFSYIL